MKYVVFLLIFIVLLSVGFSYKYFSSMFYGNSFDGINSEITKLFTDKKYEHTNTEVFEVVDILKKQPGIENSYVMSDLVNYAYYSGSKFLFTDFRSGQSSDSLNDFIQRKNWSDFDLYISNIHSYPRDKQDLFKPIPDYLVVNTLLIPYDDNNPHYQKPLNYFDVSILNDPNNEKIPSNFELLYKSDEKQVFVYKIHKNEK